MIEYDKLILPRIIMLFMVRVVISVQGQSSIGVLSVSRVRVLNSDQLW